MLESIIFFLPSLVCLVWTVMLAVTGGKDRSLHVLSALMAVATLYFFCDAYYMTPVTSVEGYRPYIYVDVISQFVTFFVPLMMVLYLRALQGKRLITIYTLVLMIPAIFQGAAASVCYAVIGIDNASKFLYAHDLAKGFPLSGFDDSIYHIYYSVCFTAYHYLLLFAVVYALCYILWSCYKGGYRFGHIIKFLRQQKVAQSYNVMGLMMVLILAICVVRVLMGRTYLINHLGVSMLMSFLLAAVIFLSDYIGVFFPYRKFSFQNFLHPTMPHAAVPIVENGVISIPGMEPVEAPDPVTPTTELKEDIIREAKTSDELNRAIEAVGVQNKLMSNFVLYMTDKKPYLEPELSIVDVATELHSNRTYVSTLLADRFGMSFREYINAQRVNAAKIYIAGHPDAILEEVASASGFSSASQFVKKFSEIVGKTPRVWQAETCK